MSKPFIVAEMSANHNGSRERALEIVRAAKYAGADAVKLQTYSPDAMVADRNYVIRRGPWIGRTLYDLYEEAQTPRAWLGDLFAQCMALGMECFSAPFDEADVEVLEGYGCPRYKVASFEITHIPLIRRIAMTGKPMVISTGMASFAEIDEAVRVAVANGCKDLTLLKCTSAYPAPASDANLATMAAMRHYFGCKVGLSDHTSGVGVAVAATMLGASMIEKHLTIDDQPGPDSHFSLQPHQFKQMVEEVARAAESLGRVHYGPTEAEQASLALRRSLYVVKDMKAGESITEQNVKPRRPAEGIAPHNLPIVVGRKIAVDAPAGTPLTWSLIGG